jgi:hypothetical protein
LFTSRTSFMNKPLADFYKVTGPTGSAFVEVTLNPNQRQGILTMAALMSNLASTTESHPVLRGKFVREQLFCQHLTPPPPGLVIIPPEPDPNLTTRERFAEHSSNATCAGCHSLMDPIGFGFENYNAVGAYRTQENGKTIDPTGTLTGTSVDGNFAGPVELSNRLANAGEVRRCLSAMWLRFFSGRPEDKTQDACTIEHSAKLFEASGNKLPALVVAMTQTDAFRYRKTVVPGGAP